MGFTGTVPRFPSDGVVRTSHSKVIATPVTGTLEASLWSLAISLCRPSDVCSESIVRNLPQPLVQHLRPNIIPFFLGNMPALGKLQMGRLDIHHQPAQFRMR